MVCCIMVLCVSLAMVECKLDLLRCLETLGVLEAVLDEYSHTAVVVVQEQYVDNTDCHPHATTTAGIGCRSPVTTQ